jgi:DTW domain-containing protein YfiP
LAENVTSIIYHKNGVTSITEKLKSIPDMAMLFPPQEDQKYGASPNNQASHSQTEQHFKALLVLDGTWIQVKQMYSSIEYLHTLKKVSLKRKYRTCFWRTQCEPEDHLATIEAIYLIYKEHDPNLDKDLKNLLLFYKINYDVIMNRSAAGPNNFN